MKFEEWLQKRLNAHGAKLREDGDWGRTSIAALEDFQRRSGLTVTGIADARTVESLRANPNGEPSFAVVTQEEMPPWMAEMHRRSGLHEVRDNASLSSWLREWGRYLGNPKNLPWCGDAVESCIAKTLPREPLPSNPFFAQDWANFGVDVGSPIVGSIGVIRWGPTSGHVGIVAGTEPGRVHLLGGNQSNAINITSFKRSKFIAFRWPSTFPVKAYPALKGGSSLGSEGGTR